MRGALIYYAIGLAALGLMYTAILLTPIAKDAPASIREPLVAFRKVGVIPLTLIVATLAWIWPVWMVVNIFSIAKALRE